MKKITIESLIIFIIILWIASWIFIDYKYTEISERGAFGDKFGFINSLFSGLALACIIYSIYLQQKDLKQQRKELKLTRSEFIEQNFQTTFFNLLKTQRELAEEINCKTFFLKSYDKEMHNIIQGRQFFISAKNEMKKIKKVLDNGKFFSYFKWDDLEDEYNEPQTADEAEELVNSRKLAFIIYNYKINKDDLENYKISSDIEKAVIIYNIFFKKYRFVIGHYFRHLYHIFHFLEKYEKEQNKEKNYNSNVFNFVNYIQAQMSTPEMYLLYYNCLKFSKMKKLVVKYNILEHLAIEDLIDPKHALEEITLS